jgi:hypothetical protein
MQVIDFARSFLTFRVDVLKQPPTTFTHEPIVTLNNARILLECRCVITDKPTARTEEFVLGASCKTERVGPDRDIWVQPNADFAPVFSKRQFLTIKTYDRVGRQLPFYPPSNGLQSDRHSGLVAEAFDNVRIDLARTEGETLSSAKAIIDSILNNDPQVAHTTYETDRYLVELQYPIKTINASEREGIYQTDTGPILFPDLSRDWDELIDGMQLAYSAFNCPDWIEFIVRVPTPINEEISVYHYSQSERVTCTNRILRCVPVREIPRPHVAAETFAKSTT